jgi:hypothetical protein
MNGAARYKHALAFSYAAATAIAACRAPASNHVAQSAQVQVGANPDSVRLDRDCELRDEHNQCTIYGPSLIALIARPELYDGKVVRVIGFVRFEFEGNALYLSRLDYENAVSRNGLWIDPPDGYRSFGGASKAQPNTVCSCRGNVQRGEAGPHGNVERDTRARVPSPGLAFPDCGATYPRHSPGKAGAITYTMASTAASVMLASSNVA